MKTALKNILILFLIQISGIGFAQQTCNVQGRVSDEFQTPVAFAHVYYKVGKNKVGTETNNGGRFSLEIPANKEITIYISHLQFSETFRMVKGLPNENVKLNVTLKINPFLLEGTEIINKKSRETSIHIMDSKKASFLPTTNADIMGLVKLMPGVSTAGGEFSSQYAVRGGNFDENLVYVNDIEVYRPFLIRSGQQEGLSFVNTDLTSKVTFSAGGFEAKYGDKMSSVLDIKYKKPTEFGGSVTGSLLGGSAHIEGATKNHIFTHITGVRYKTFSYVLNSLDTKGDYSPSFADIQTYLTYDLSPKFELNFLGNYAMNKYLFKPTDRQTSYGTVSEALSLKVYFDGQEVDKFTTMFGSMAGIYKPRDYVQMKFIASAFQTVEQETFDILGQYYLNELDKQLGSDNLGDSISNIGIGSFLDHARNYLNATVLNFSYKGYIFPHIKRKNKSSVLWGMKIQHEIIDDKINEWKLLDSAGYTLPYSDTVVNLSESLNSLALLQSTRATAYFQYGRTYQDSLKRNTYGYNAGIRGNYWDYNNQLLVSPRINFFWTPTWYQKKDTIRNEKTKTDIVFRFSTGYYYQPPFYKELRGLDGIINPEIRAQKSIHFVLGSDYVFEAWDRTFKLMTELYYKYMTNLIPYDVDNVRIRYYATNNSKGYATGIDFKLHGEFVKGVESWVNLSVMQTKENLTDDYYFDTTGTTIFPGFIPRPGDQRVNFSMFFQDYLPGNKSYKMSLNLVYGTGMPFGPPNGQKYQSVLRFPAYRRVDIGFIKVIKTDENPEDKKFKNFKNIWISLEIFNLLGINNTISHTWIRDINNRQYAVPNYLSGRRLNIKLHAEF
ncbi:MAG: carboxypeptidase-like regulatory domain-containing protein [Bacteroidales bacterium]|nr:carboxypeptidase-like regulatory domain-containing protein [Bacteroidales bacterium]